MHLYFSFFLSKEKKTERKQAGAELGQAQLKLELGLTSTKIWGIANYYILVNMVRN